MSTHAQAHDPGHQPAHGHAPHRNYLKIWAILLGLLVVSVTGPMVGIRMLTLITAFGVALVKGVHGGEELHAPRHRESRSSTGCC